MESKRIQNHRGKRKMGKWERGIGGTVLIFIPPHILLSAQPRLFAPFMSFQSRFPRTYFSLFFPPIPLPLGPRKQTDFGEGTRRPRPMIRWEGRNSGSPSGGWLVSYQTYCFNSHPERGQGGPRDESADRSGRGGAAEKRDWGLWCEGCESQCSDGPMAPARPSSSLLSCLCLFRFKRAPPDGRLPADGYKFPHFVRQARFSSFFFIHPS